MYVCNNIFNHSFLAIARSANRPHFGPYDSYNRCGCMQNLNKVHLRNDKHLKTLFDLVKLEVNTISLPHH